jgi:hypothetical protein
MVYPMVGTVEGATGDQRVAGATFYCQRTLVDSIVGRLGDAIDAATAELSIVCAPSKTSIP